VLLNSTRDIVGQPNIKLSLAISDDINAISHRG
jgi:hypothetical protein